MDKNEIRLNQLVKTTKGAQFWGRVIGTHDMFGDKPGAVVEAIAEGFQGTRHVYPIAQLEPYADKTPELIEGPMITAATGLAGRFVRHGKTKGVYYVLNVARMQTTHWRDTQLSSDYRKVDMERVVVYISMTDGSMWVRPEAEFLDGRFTEVFSK